MKVLELLDEIEDIIETSPVSAYRQGLGRCGNIGDHPGNRIELPDEIQQAQWIKDERQRTLTSKARI